EVASNCLDVDPRRSISMDRGLPEVVGVRRTGWAALDRDPQQDVVEFVCPHCGAKGQKKARRERAGDHLSPGVFQGLQGEGVRCPAGKRWLGVVPVVMLYDQEETRRFEAFFLDEPVTSAHS